ncbi:hypothetical protein GQX73_g2162 [Xylaria multiplex]|uniref:C2H2-type domain-containing protein n=1 Tax=Xylaria multiplex TaxID=323545 RepID=A0A7C8IUM6_9PEZI|nr:hypothetical protein GQX73_g2162 [Xylaria multiplex]
MNDQFDLGFSFRGDQLSRSFSTSSDESLQGPATPPSGRSTPGLFEPTDQGNMAYGTLDMGATPPASTFGPFPTDVLKDGSHCLTLDPALYEPGIVTPQFDFPQQDYTLGDICNMSQWPWPPENESIMFLNGLQPKMPNQAFYLPHAYPFVQEQTIPLSLAQGRPQEQPPARVPARPQRQAQGRLQEQPPAQAPARPRRQAQGKVLHRVQDGGVKPRARPQANKRNNMPMVKIGKGLEKLEVGLCPRSGFECPGVEDPITKKIVDCFKRFQRKEHLKRHIKT